MQKAILKPCLISALKNYNGADKDAFKAIFPEAQMVSHNQWIELIEETQLDFEPTETFIYQGDYGKNLLVIYACKWPDADYKGETDIFLQWTYQYEGFLLTEYYKVSDFRK